MQYIEYLYKYLTPVISVIIAIVTMRFTHNDNQSSVARERLEKVYHPLFVAIEPFLYKNVSYETVQPFLTAYYEAEASHLLLINPSLSRCIHVLSKDPDCFERDKYGNCLWFDICDIVSNDYDKLCKRAFLPVRNIHYRLCYKQYRTKMKLLLNTLLINLPSIIFIGLFLALLHPYLLLCLFLLLFCLLLRAWAEDMK